MIPNNQVCVANKASSENVKTPGLFLVKICCFGIFYVILVLLQTGIFAVLPYVLLAQQLIDRDESEISTYQGRRCSLWAPA